MLKKYNYYYSYEERKNFYQGIKTARKDFIWCCDDRQKVRSCMSSRRSIKNLCYQRKDKNGVSFQNGYLYYFNKKLGK